MSCEDIKGLFPEYWDGKLDEADRLILEAHLARCQPCRIEADELRPVWSGLGELATEATPGEGLRTRFYDRLEAYRMGASDAPAAPTKQASSKVVSIRRYWPAVGIAAALAIGFFSGYQIDNRKDNVQVSQLRGEVSSMRQMVALSLLQQQSASDRLQGVNWTYRVERSDTEVLSALLYTINHDPNVNVRMAAVDAMKTFADSPVARRGLVQAIAKQESPLVQIALMDQLIELRERSAAPAIEALSKSNDADPTARERARWALGKIQ